MKKISLILSLLSTSLLAAWGGADIDECSTNVRPIRLGLRHIEGKGIGYTDGYTTAEGFFQVLGDRWFPFVDLRTHVFNDGKWAANAGVGIRYSHDWVYGLYAYYDYRRTHRLHYNQASLGFEMLGRCFDFRINGYFPIGKKRSSSYHAEFHSFSGNNLYISKKYEFAMKGANAEAGFHLLSAKNVDLYAAIGPYYFGGQGKNAWGGEARIAFNFWRRLRLEGSGSYDTVFKWIGQGQLGLYFPLGNKKKVKRADSYDCDYGRMQLYRATQTVDRSEIIVIDDQTKKSTAIDPNTGQPYQVWFVSNTSNSKGTWESPFPTLLQAQDASNAHDIIYVLTGDGSTQGLNQGLSLKPHQRVLGAGIQHRFATNLGEIDVPAHASGMPMLDASGNTAAILLADDCEVAGLHVVSSFGGAGILGSGISNTYIHNNLISNGSSHGISLNNCSGTLQVSDNIISSLSGTGIRAEITEGSVAEPILAISNNTISIAGSGIAIEHRGAGMIDLQVESNSALNVNSHALSVSNLSPAVGRICGSITNNRTLSFSGSSIDLSASQTGEVELQLGNNLSLDSGQGFTAQASQSAFMCLNLWNNIDQEYMFSQNHSSHFRLESSTGNLKGFQARNTGNASTSGNIQFVIPGTCGCP